MKKIIIFLLFTARISIYSMQCSRALFDKEDLNEEEQEFQLNYWNSKKRAYDLANKIGITTLTIGTCTSCYYKVTSHNFSFISGMEVTGFATLASLGAPILVHKCKYNYERFKRGLL